MSETLARAHGKNCSVILYGFPYSLQCLEPVLVLYVLVIASTKKEVCGKLAPLCVVRGSVGTSQGGRVLRDSRWMDGLRFQIVSSARFRRFINTSTS